MLGEQGLFSTIEASGAPAPDEAFPTLKSWRVIKVRPLHQSRSSWISLCPLAQQREEGTYQRRFSHLTSKKASSGGSLLSWVQRHWQTAMASSSATVVEEDENPHILRIKEQGKVFQQNVGVMWDSLREEVARPSSGVMSKAAPLSSVQRVELPQVEVPFSPFVRQRLAELSTDLCGDVDGNDVAISGDCGLHLWKLLPKPKARVDSYRINRAVFKFVASNVDTPLKARNVQEAEFVSVPLNSVQRFEQDAQMLTMVRSFLDCSGTTSTWLLQEASRDDGALESTRQLVGTLLDLERSRGRAVGHFVSSAITLDCKIKLVQRNALLPS